MTHLYENFVIDAKGNRVGVFLPIKDYNKLLEELKELDDIKAYDKAMSRKQEFVPLEQALKRSRPPEKRKSNVPGRYRETGPKGTCQDPAPDYNKVVAAVKALADDPRPHGYKKIKGRPGYRIRAGDYRIIYQVKDNILTVFVLIIGNRRDVYD